jgi:hypothetical protein
MELASLCHIGQNPVKRIRVQVQQCATLGFRHTTPRKNGEPEKESPALGKFLVFPARGELCKPPFGYRQRGR